MSNALKTASVLAFERKLDPSDAVFHAGNWEDLAKSASWPPVRLREKSVRGTISNRLKAKDQDPAKLDAAIENPNLQTVDVATLPSDADTLKVQFTLRVLPGTGTPSACNSAEYQAKLLQTVQSYVAEHGYAELANRYAANLANGRFLWRNRVGAEHVRVEVARLKDGKAEQQWRFDALAQNLRALDALSDEVKSLGSVIAEGLASGHVLLQVTAFLRVGAGQEVFPSQELILDRGRGDKSKTLYQIGEKGQRSPPSIPRRSAMPCALSIPGTKARTIWGRSLWNPTVRSPRKERPIASPSRSRTSIPCWTIGCSGQGAAGEQQHFVMAVLIRGGVFGDAS